MGSLPVATTGSGTGRKGMPRNGTHAEDENACGGDDCDGEPIHGCKPLSRAAQRVLFHGKEWKS